MESAYPSAVPYRAPEEAATVKRVLGAVAAVFMASGVALPQEVGRVHSGVRLPTIDGERTVSLEEFRGKKVLLIEFASW